MPRWPARSLVPGPAVPAAAGAIAVAAGLLAIAPLVSLVIIALGETGDLWTHLARHVIPAALVETALLLAGVAVVTIAVGVGTAWTVATFAFPGRDTLAWLLALPLAIPTYIVAYVYVDLLDALGPVQSALRTIFGWPSAADYWFPNVRSLGGAVVMRLHGGPPDGQICGNHPQCRSAIPVRSSKRGTRHAHTLHRLCQWSDSAATRWRTFGTPVT